jgi:putative ABC transport system substrate-binding protein
MTTRVTLHIAWSYASPTRKPLAIHRAGGSTPSISSHRDEQRRLIGRQTQQTVIATPDTIAASIAAKSATATIPIVFGVGEVARPGGNATGVNFFAQELVAKRLAVLHELVPKAVRVAVLVNPANGPIVTELILREVQEAARTIGLQIQVLNATTIEEIDAAFGTLARDRPDALFVTPDSFFVSRRAQITNLAARERIAATNHHRDCVVAGGLILLRHEMFCLVDGAQ